MHCESATPFLLMQGELQASEASNEDLTHSLGELDCLVADLQVERTEMMQQLQVQRTDLMQQLQAERADLMQQLDASQLAVSTSCRRAEGLEAQLARAAGEAQQAARVAGEMQGQVQEAQAAAAAARDATVAAENKVRGCRDVLSLGYVTYVFASWTS